MVFFSALLMAAAAFVVAIPIFVGVYVYRDAAQRGMEAVLWTAVAVFVPGFIGLIIYLLCRKSDGVRCPKCGNPVSYEYMLCPFCGQHLKESCEGCGETIEPGWRLCPRCGRELEQTKKPDAYAAPVGHKDKALGWIITVIVVIPLVFLLAAILLFRIPG